MNSTQQIFLNASNQNPRNTTLATLKDGYICLLEDQSLMQVSGDDAASFLHNQLSNDVQHLKENEARYAAYCTPKGRMLASLLYWQQESAIVLQASASLQPALQKRLQMFIMRAKAKIEDVTANLAIIGLAGKQAETFLLPLFANLPQTNGEKMSNDAGTLIRMHDAFDMPRYQWIVSHEKFAEIWASKSHDLTQLDASIWRLGEIHAGIPQVIAQTQEKFVPQMINFELIGGVNFKKGCYPGQEIVARSQYLGKLKRRMAIALVKADAVQVGMEIFSENDPSQACGMIVNVERNFGEEFACLVEIKVADQVQTQVHLASNEGPLLHFLPLPYAYLDITE